uniref:Uncharacterized protein n=1 Tax=Steinernema glaseri TaxID=37863 RepID=A0A1I8AT41_9BILA
MLQLVSSTPTRVVVLEGSRKHRHSPGGQPQSPEEALLASDYTCFCAPGPPAPREMKGRRRKRPTTWTLQSLIQHAPLTGRHQRLSDRQTVCLLCKEHLFIWSPKEIGPLAGTSPSSESQISTQDSISTPSA